MNRNDVKYEIKNWLEKYCFNDIEDEKLKTAKAEDLWSGNLHVASFMVGKYCTQSGGLPYPTIFALINEAIAEELTYRANVAK